MKNSFGNGLTVTLFGESHGTAVGAVADGFESGISVREDEIAAALLRRSPLGFDAALSTARREKDGFTIVSGVKDGFTTGAPLCVMIANAAQRPEDYRALEGLARPSHGDLELRLKYGGHADLCGGGHFSGRLTAALTALGAVARRALSDRGTEIGTHISALAGIADRDFDTACPEKDIALLNDEEHIFAVLDPDAAERMKTAVRQAGQDGDSVGGILSTCVTGLPAGIGEPWFDTAEGMLSHALFSIPGVKGVQFGDGFALAPMRGSEANDGYLSLENGRAKTRTNHSGGVNAGITNGMPLRFDCAVKPTPTIAKEQALLDTRTGKAVNAAVSGRHDPAIVHRARAAVDAVTALTLYGMLREAAEGAK